MFAIVLFLAQIAAPQLPNVELDTDQESIVRLLATEWRGKAPVPDAPLVVLKESMAAGDIASIRLELLRHGVDAARTEQIAKRLSTSPASSMSTRLFDDRFIASISGRDLFMKARTREKPAPLHRNLAATRAIALPALDDARRGAAIVFVEGNAIFHEERNDRHFVFFEKTAKGWMVAWDSRFTPAMRRERSDSPLLATFTPDDFAVIDAALDVRFNDRSKRLLVENETSSQFELFPIESKVVEAAATKALVTEAMNRNTVALFLPAPKLGRPMTMVPRERFFDVIGKSRELFNGPAGFVRLGFPAYSADQRSALVGYLVGFPTATGGEIGSEVVLLRRDGAKWVVGQHWYSMSIGSPGSRPDAPFRVGGGVKAPVVLKRVDVRLPKGTPAHTITIAELIIDASGHIADVTLLNSVPPGLEPKVLDALRHWEFSPGSLNGKPVKVLYDVTISYIPAEE